MADEKGGGGNQWGTLEILLVILLLIGVLDHITGRNKDTLSESNQTITQQEELHCGLDVIAPKRNEKIGTTFVIKGSVGTCDWQTSNGIALYAQVVDTKGIPLTHYIAIPAEHSAFNDAATVSFSATVTLTATPSSKTGYLILVPAVAVASGGTISQTHTARIPVTF